MASISKPPGSKNWIIQFYFQGRKYRRSLKVSVKRDAVQLKHLVERQLAEGTFDPGAILRKKSPKITYLSELIEKWQQHLDRRGDLKEATRIGYVQNAAILLDLAGDVRLGTFTPAYIQDDLLLELQARYPSPATVKNKMIAWRAIFSFAARHGIVRSNPFAGQVPDYQRRVPVWFREGEIETYKTYWSDPVRQKWQQTYFLTLLSTGNRKTEHFNLTWPGNVFLDEMCLKFPGKGRYTGKERIVPLNDAALEQFRRAQRKLGEERVFWQVRSVAAVRSAWEIFRRKTGFAHTIHNVRSNRATWLVREGMSIYKVMRVMGWEDYNTAKIYLGFSKEFVESERNLANF